MRPSSKADVPQASRPEAETTSGPTPQDPQRTKPLFVRGWESMTASFRSVGLKISHSISDFFGSIINNLLRHFSRNTESHQTARQHIQKQSSLSGNALKNISASVLAPAPEKPNFFGKELNIDTEKAIRQFESALNVAEANRTDSMKEASTSQAQLTLEPLMPAVGTTRPEENIRNSEAKLLSTLIEKFNELKRHDLPVPSSDAPTRDYGKISTEDYSAILSWLKNDVSEVLQSPGKSGIQGARELSRAMSAEFLSGKSNIERLQIVVSDLEAAANGKPGKTVSDPAAS